MERDTIPLHNRMRSLSAKLYGLRVLVSTITSESTRANKNERKRQDDERDAALSRLVEINFGIRCDRGRWITPASTPLVPHAGEHHAQTKHEKRGQDDVRDDDEVRVVGCLRQLDEKQQQDTNDRRNHDHGAREAYVISKE